MSDSSQSLHGEQILEILRALRSTSTRLYPMQMKSRRIEQSSETLLTALNGDTRSRFLCMSSSMVILTTPVRTLRVTTRYISEQRHTSDGESWSLPVSLES